MMIMKNLIGVCVVIVAGLSPAYAHLGDLVHEHGLVKDFAWGLTHPLSGLDHILGMLAIGLWAGCVGGSARWLWPLTFVTVAGLAAMIGQSGYQLALLEPLIAASVIMLGAFVYAGLRLPLLAGVAMSAAAAFVHGYAHGIEMAGNLDAGSFMVGFLMATGLLHGLGLMLSLRMNGVIGRVAGGLISLCGSYLLMMAV